MIDAASISDFFIPADCPSKTRAYSDGKRMKAEENNELQNLASQLLDICKQAGMQVGDDQFINALDSTYRVHLESRRSGSQYSLRRLPGFRPRLTSENQENITFPQVMCDLVEKQLKIPGGGIHNFRSSRCW